jgi:hypothetical protein
VRAAASDFQLYNRSILILARSVQTTEKVVQPYRFQKRRAHRKATVSAHLREPNFQDLLERRARRIVTGRRHETGLRPAAPVRLGRVAGGVAGQAGGDDVAGYGLTAGVARDQMVGRAELGMAGLAIGIEGSRKERNPKKSDFWGFFSF